MEIPGRPGWRIAGETRRGRLRRSVDERARKDAPAAGLHYKFCFDVERLRALKREVTLTRLLRVTLGERDDIVRIDDLRLDEPPCFSKAN